MLKDKMSGEKREQGVKEEKEDGGMWGRNEMDKSCLKEGKVRMERNPYSRKERQNDGGQEGKMLKAALWLNFRRDRMRTNCWKSQKTEGEQKTEERTPQEKENCGYFSLCSDGKTGNRRRREEVKRRRRRRTRFSF